MGLVDGLRLIQAAGLRRFQKKDVEEICNRLSWVPAGRADEIIGQILKEESCPKNLIRYIEVRARKKQDVEIPDRWYIINGLCYRCSGTGVVQDLREIQFRTGTIWETRLMACDCPAGKRWPSAESYYNKYRDNHQFPFSQEIIMLRPSRITYQEIYSIYEVDFLVRKRTNPDAMPELGMRLIQERYSK